LIFSRPHIFAASRMKLCKLFIIEISSNLLDKLLKQLSLRFWKSLFYYLLLIVNSYGSKENDLDKGLGSKKP